jgi:hypothetical protein
MLLVTAHAAVRLGERCAPACRWVNYWEQVWNSSRAALTSHFGTRQADSFGGDELEGLELIGGRECRMSLVE